MFIERNILKKNVQRCEAIDKEGKREKNNLTNRQNDKRTFRQTERKFERKSAIKRAENSLLKVNDIFWTNTVLD